MALWSSKTLFIHCYSRQKKEHHCCQHTFCFDIILCSTPLNKYRKPICFVCCFGSHRYGPIKLMLMIYSAHSHKISYTFCFLQIHLNKHPPNLPKYAPKPASNVPTSPKTSWTCPGMREAVGYIWSQMGFSTPNTSLKGLVRGQEADTNMVRLLSVIFLKQMILK